MRFLDELRACWLTTLIGALLLTFGTSVLFWNEGRAIRTILSLEEAMDDAITVSGERPYEKMFEGRLVHITGPITTGEPLTEPDYNIMVQSIKLRRRVQMYQWVEETVEHNFADTVSSVQSEDRTYYYSMEWRDKLIDSRSFYLRPGHQNPTSFPIDSKIHVADRVHIGQYELGPAVKEKIKDFIEVTSDTRPEDPSVKLHSGIYYHCNDLFNPEIGDIRIQFYYAGLEGTTYTIIGQLDNGKIVPYETTFGKKILLVYSDELNLEQAFKREHHSQRMTTWGFRFFGWILLFLSATCSASIMKYLTTQHRVLLRLVPDPAFPVSTNITLSFSLALVITSIAWIIHRPWLGTGLLFAAISPFLYCARGVANYQRLD